MHAALQWVVDTGISAVGLRLAIALWGFWRSYGFISEGCSWLQHGLAIDEQSIDPAIMALRQRALHAAAWLASDQHDFEAASQLFEESTKLRSDGEASEGTIEGYINAARQARMEGRYRQSAALLMDILSQRGPPLVQRPMADRSTGLSYDDHGQVLRELGLVVREQGDFARATALFQEALQLYKAKNDRVSEALAMLGLGDIARDQGDGPAVRLHCEPSLAIFREFGMAWAIGFALNTLALGAHYEGISHTRLI